MRDILVCIVGLGGILIGLGSLVTHSWEYRAVYHYDCNSYLTES